MPEPTISLLNFARTRTRTYDSQNNLTETLQALLQIVCPVGSVVPTLLEAEPGDGWKICNGQALLKSEYPRLYAALGGRFGQTATTFSLPDLRGRMPLGASLVGDIGLIGGAASLVLTEAQLPPHTHVITDPGHDHDFTGSPHTHTVNDPGHTHVVTDPGHTHTAAVVDSGVAAAGVDVDGAASGDTGSSGTGISIASAETGITVDAASVAGTIGPASTGITAEETGAGVPIDIMPPYISVNWMVRT